jgi:signal transduction histidine kinase
MCDRPFVSTGQLLDRWRDSVDPAETTIVVVRAGVLCLCGLLSLLTEREVPSRDLALLFVIALASSVPMPRSWFTGTRPVLEAIAAAAVIGSATPLHEPLLPYLVVPPLAAGLLSGVLASLLTNVASLAVLVAGRAVGGDLTSRSEVTLIAEWVGLGVATGLVGAWARSVARREKQANSTYLSAHRLLTRLRDVTRALPTGLDEVALAQQVLSRMRDDLDFDRAALYARSESGVLVPLSVSGAEHVDWTPTPDEGIWHKVLQSGRAVQQTGTFTDPSHGHSAALALRLGDRRVGLVAMERDAGPWSPRTMEKAQHLADDAALRIDTGQLFSEVRALATVEERRRLAREIHDGVAQEVASLGYVVDDLTARETDDDSREDLQRLRDELTRIVSELRLSIFDLRSDVQPTAGLGSALTGYIRTVGAGSGITVHLVLDESAQRLPIEAETELLRVAQEAITNARKHARARNLWVTCRVDPPRAFLRIADDGRGLGTPRSDSFGMDIMRERSTRVGAVFSARNRVGGGTVIEVTLGSTSRAGRPGSELRQAPAVE